MSYDRLAFATNALLLLLIISMRAEESLMWDGYRRCVIANLYCIGPLASNRPNGVDAKTAKAKAKKVGSV